MTDHEREAMRAMRLILQASRRLDRLGTTLAFVTLRKIAMTMAQCSSRRPEDASGIAIALMRIALVLLDSDDRYDVACRLQAALDTALDMPRARWSDEIDDALIEVMPLSSPEL